MWHGLALACLSLLPCCARAQCSGRSPEQCSGECGWQNLCLPHCFEEGVAYVGDLLGQPITNPADKEDCKWHCQNTAGCHRFTFYPASRNCHLHDATAARQRQWGATAGIAAACAGSPADPALETESMPVSVRAAVAAGRDQANRMILGFRERVSSISWLPTVASRWPIAAALVAVALLVGALLYHRSRQGHSSSGRPTSWRQLAVVGADDGRAA